MLVHVIADFGLGDLAFAEVCQRIRFQLPDAECLCTPVPPFATLAAGFAVAQLGLNDPPPGTLLFHNVAPRQDDTSARRDNDGERLAYALLPGGVRVVGVNAGYAFSFLREAALELRYLGAPSGGSQFRSRDIFPLSLVAVARGEETEMADPLPKRLVPEVPPARIAYVDGFGNLKTTIPFTAGLQPGSSLQVRVGGVERDAVMSDGGFAVPQGKLAFSPGSSGWADGRGGRLRWMELFWRGGSAWEAFGRPGIGALIELL